jgi:hypothetical protein
MNFLGILTGYQAAVNADNLVVMGPVDGFLRIGARVDHHAHIGVQRLKLGLARPVLKAERQL